MSRMRKLATILDPEWPNGIAVWVRDSLLEFVHLLCFWYSKFAQEPTNSQPLQPVTFQNA